MREVQQNNSEAPLDLAEVRPVQNASDCSSRHEAASRTADTAVSIQVQPVAVLITTNVRCIQRMLTAYLMCCQAFVCRCCSLTL